MRNRNSALAIVLFAVTVPAPGSSQGTASLNGTFVYDSAASDDVKKAIDGAVAQMNFLIRPVARGRLRKASPLYQRMTISHTPQQVTITMDARPSVVTPADGTPVEVTRENGEKLKVSTEWENSALEQTFEVEDGKRVNIYTLSPDGRTVTMNVTINSPRLQKPLKYKLVYRRG